jgi:hypothetical protein
MTKKSFDAVKMMRELRDKLSRDMEHMTAEERVQYIRDRAAWTEFSKGTEQEPRATNKE